MITVRATDPSGAPGEATVTITVTDVNEAPKFPATAPTALTVTEEPGVETPTKELFRPDGDDEGDDPDDLAPAAYVVTDDDGADDDHTYDLEGADAKKFSITSDTGVLTVATDHTPDFEKQPSYSITIMATDANTDDADHVAMTGKLDVTIKVVDAEDGGSVSIMQREPQVGRSVTARVSDPDGGVTKVAWQWASADASAFDEDDRCRTATSLTWGDLTGATSSSYSPEATDEDNCLRATAMYEDAIAGDGDETDQDTMDEAAMITERPVQDADPANTAPKFSDLDPDTAGVQDEEITREVKENTKDGVSLGEAINAGDTDGDLLIHSLGGPDADSFGIERTSGQLMTKAALDYETKKVYTVTITATDPSLATDTVTVTINVTDEDDKPTITLRPAENTAPTFADDAETDFMVYENMDAGAAVGMVMATDEDGDTLTYTDDSGYFDVDDMGNITTAMMLDHEAMASHMVTVTASDGEDDASIAVTVNVGNVEECEDAGAMAVADTSNAGLMADCEALLMGGDMLSGDGSLNWAIDTSIMDWTGVVISGDPMRVTQLRLTRKGLSGSIPASLGYLSELENLYLNANSLQGMVPGELGMLTNLADLRLHNNELEGLEMGLGGMSSLTRFWAHRNHLSGSIPSDFGDLDSLVWLRLDTPLEGDGLSGGTAALGGMDSIERLYLHGNDFGGASVLSDVSGLDTLTHLLLQRSGVSGTIPDLSGMTSLVWLGLYDNGLSDGIPATVGSLANLKRLYLHGNALTGAVPMEIGSLASLTNLWLKNNMLEGELPSSLDNLTDLVRVRISGGNTFTGCIPAALANAASTDAADTGLATCGDGGQ